MLSSDSSDGCFSTTTSIYRILDIILGATLPQDVKANLLKLSGEKCREGIGGMLVRLLRGDVRKLTEVEEMFKDFVEMTAPRYGLENKPARARNPKKL